MHVHEVDNLCLAYGDRRNGFWPVPMITGRRLFANRDIDCVLRTRESIYHTLVLLLVFLVSFFAFSIRSRSRREVFFKCNIMRSLTGQHPL